MFNNILVPLDGSDYGERVLAYVADLAQIAGARVTLLNVVASDGPLAGDEQEIARCRAYLDEHAKTLADLGVGTVEVDVRSGVVAAAIAEAARVLEVDLIAMSTQGLSAESDEGLGSVASQVLVSAPCPVFMVRIRRPEPPRGVAEERWQSEGGANVG
jgi:nucleotide-binding universal stress UspA family protein